MTLAVIFISIYLTASSPTPAATSQNAQPAPATANNTQNQGSAPSQNTPAASKPNTAQASPGQKPTATKPLRKKKVSSPGCDSGSAAGPGAPSPGSAASLPGPTNTSSGGGSSATRPATAPANCPPTKVVVRQGGASEPAVQLAGGPGGDQAAQQRNTANQMLAATDQNLKKIAGRNLTASQQDMVNQIHQFTEQSKAATAAGDLDSARTLAWKAQLLSEELTKPEK